MHHTGRMHMQMLEWWHQTSPQTIDIHNEYAEYQNADNCHSTNEILRTVYRTNTQRDIQRQIRLN